MGLLLLPARESLLSIIPIIVLPSQMMKFAGESVFTA